MMTVRPARPEDVASLAPRLRDADRREIQAFSGREPVEELRRGLSLSDPACALVDEADVPLALFGAAPARDRPGVGFVWLLAAPEAVRRRVAFLRLSREWVARLQERYPVLTNCVDARNTVHLRWLAWCGFSLTRLVPEYGVERRPFYEFRKVRGD
jgi:hypothetical protein